MYMFMGLVSWIDKGMVASSSPVGESGRLQCGIRAHIAARASMGHEELVIEAGFPLPSRKNEKLEKLQENFRKFSKCENYRMS